MNKFFNKNQNVFLFLFYQLQKVLFITFLVFIFVYVFLNPPFIGGDIYALQQGKLFINDKWSVHPYPLLSPILFSILPTWFILLISPFTAVIPYILIYYLVSKRIIYFFPISGLSALYRNGLIPQTIDILLLPITYYFLKEKENKKAIFISVIMVYFHGFIPLFYLSVVYLYINKARLLAWVYYFSIPQLIPLWYFSRDYFKAHEGMIYQFNIFSFLNYKFDMNFNHFRIVMILLYTIMFILVIGDDRN
jgi:hypothetical protein